MDMNGFFVLVHDDLPRVENLVLPQTKIFTLTNSLTRFFAWLLLLSMYEAADLFIIRAVNMNARFGIFFMLPRECKLM